MSDVEGIHEERIHVGVSTNGYFKGISEVEAEENNETLGDHVECWCWLVMALTDWTVVLAGAD